MSEFIILLDSPGKTAVQIQLKKAVILHVIKKLGGNPFFRAENFFLGLEQTESFYNNPFSVFGIKSASNSEERNVYFSMA